MSASVEDTSDFDLALCDEGDAGPMSDREPSKAAASDGHDRSEAVGRDDGPDRDPSRTDNNIVLDQHDDRWHWRRKIRADPRKLVFYRFAVGFAGLLFVSLGLVTGPFPGPGGIPLVLLGLAIWSSEFEWAQRLMFVFKRQLERFRSWSRWQQTAFWIVFFACCGLIGYSSMLLFGVPEWLPDIAKSILSVLPGI
ncbi:hypothetical protein GCM10009841_22800 [Microlunatus panaciterrae]|uniref:Uncharacterized protein (TIGR02611 family) n=1 Tax=Microlunatus panaciterrae TaxID=400768 RepID=A0ABS2REQ9_9ACTN|nr:PGPGW domain-containing protein [Microlunatus panaciterrae]MBM7797163.1 uncharacterized protein (TIGR02611 family) [Microlunatus panaciterrae]